MSRTTSREPAKDDVEKLFQDIFPGIPDLVRKVCARLDHYPDQVEVDGFAQRIAYLLWENDYRVLRSFNRESLPETWLFTIAKRHIWRGLRERERIERLDDMPPNSFAAQSDQEERLLLRERIEILQKAVSNLTEHDKMLFELLRQEHDIEKIAEKMGIKRRSASVMKSVLITKLRRIIRSGAHLD